MLQERGDALLIGSRNSLGISVDTGLPAKWRDAWPTRRRVKGGKQDRCREREIIKGQHSDSHGTGSTGKRLRIFHFHII